MEKPKLTLTDRILADTVLPLIPYSVRPNALTWFRFATIIPVGYLFVLEEYLYGLVLFSLSAFSDALDGSLARARGQITDWGKKFDPLADKLLIGTAALILVSRFVNVYLAATIIILELFIVGSAYYRERVYGEQIEAELSGKVKMVLQSLGIISLLISVAFQSAAFLAVAAYMLYLSIIFAIISLVVYKSI